MIIYTDGACSGNPGPGGFGVVVLPEGENTPSNKVLIHSEKCAETTNNREELKAIFWAFMRYGVPEGEWQEAPVVYSDSSYCVNTFTNWMFQWYNHGWIKANKEIPENLDIIKPFFKHWQDGYRIDLRKVKGHAGNQWNELADQLATGKFKV